jgi:glutaredoxin
MIASNRELGQKIFWGILIVGIIIILWKGVSVYTQQTTDKGNVIVYGSKTCPWCVKQEDYLKDKGIPYEFVDCKDQQCPEFVQGFPTLMIDNVVKSGYSEI